MYRKTKIKPAINIKTKSKPKIHEFKLTLELIVRLRIN